MKRSTFPTCLTEPWCLNVCTPSSPIHKNQTNPHQNISKGTASQLRLAFEPPRWVNALVSRHFYETTFVFNSEPKTVHNIYLPVSSNVAGRKIPEPNNSMEVSILSMGKSSRNEDFSCSKLLIQDKQATDRLADCSKMLKAWFYFRSIWTWKPSWLPRPPPDLLSPPASSQSS